MGPSLPLGPHPFQCTPDARLQTLDLMFSLLGLGLASSQSLSAFLFLPFEMEINTFCQCLDSTFFVLTRLTAEVALGLRRL